MSSGRRGSVRGRRKKFDEGLYDRYNHAAIEAVMNHLMYSSGLYSQVNSDKYGPDVVVYHGFREIQYVEVEVKLVWRSSQDIFPFPSIQLPERKGKFAGLSIPTEFWVLREDMTKAVVIPDYTLSMYPPVEVSNRFVEKGEYFYQIPISSTQQIDLHTREEVGDDCT